MTLSPIAMLGVSRLLVVEGPNGPSVSLDPTDCHARHATSFQGVVNRTRGAGASGRPRPQATSQMVWKAAATTSALVAAAEWKTAGTEVVPQLWSLSVWTVGEAFCPNSDLPSAMVTAVANPASPYAPTTTEAPDPEIAPELCAVPELQAAA